jgi:hypothetical protein
LLDGRGDAGYEVPEAVAQLGIWIAQTREKIGSYLWLAMRENLESRNLGIGDDCVST